LLAKNGLSIAALEGLPDFYIEAESRLNKQE
jgi:hypothetical protein